jgi:low affinity Fe/Cu permease
VIANREVIALASDGGGEERVISGALAVACESYSGGSAEVKRMPNTNFWFAKMAQKAASVAGSSPAFMAVCIVTAAWLVSGPFFRWSDAWQLVINTLSNIVAMLMLFLIQNTQNRETSALQLKVDELLRAVRGAENAFIKLEDLTEEDLTRIKERYARLAEMARAKSDVHEMPGSASDARPE